MVMGLNDSTTRAYARDLQHNRSAAFVQPTVRPCDLRDVLLMLPLPLPLVVVRRLLLIRGRFRCISLGFALHPK